ncbi:hypothetical protein HPB47_005444 [Ixodes persulcatus]|uniref:Uncharacterized protein n=1 Tax=Ixodes persulcatus TaxID=34615 RepID=A0AC60PDT0_IXOPE|nr:hypothetical protein HPB47_005444 [Ixodes persulcatus]
MRLKSNPSPRNCDFEHFAQNLCEDASRYTKHVSMTTTVPEDDAQLLHLWEARRGLLERWRRQKINRKLKYATQLARFNWHPMSNKLQGTLCMLRTWSFIRHLLNPTKSKSHTSRALRTIVHNFKGTSKEILQKLISRSTGEAPSRTHILGLHLQQYGGATHTMQLLQESTTQIMHLIRMTQAFIISRITYAAPYLNLKKGDEERLDAITCKAFKIALGLPLYTSDEKLLNTGLYNTYHELAEAKPRNQTETGDHIDGVMGQDKTPTPATLRTGTAASAEEMALALAIDANGPQQIAVLTDSPTAIRLWLWLEPNKESVAHARTRRRPSLHHPGTRSGHGPIHRNFLASRNTRSRSLGVLTRSTSYVSTTTSLSNPRGGQMTWEAALLSLSPNDQQMLLQRAKAAAENTGALD